MKERKLIMRQVNLPDKERAMKQTTIPMKEDARLIVKTGGDIMIEGSDSVQLTAIVDDGDSFRMKDENGVIYIKSDSNAKLTIPRKAELTVEWVGGDASVAGLSSRAVIQKVGGDLVLQSMGDVSIESVGGDCFCREIGGSLDIRQVGGDLDGFKVSTVKAVMAGGDISLSGLNGAVEVNAGGDIHVQCSMAEIPVSRLHAGGDISFRVLPGTHATLEMKSSGEEINVSACGQQLSVEQSEYSLPLGEGGNKVELQAGGDIDVSEGKESTNEFSFVFDNLGETWRDFGKEIEMKIKQGMKSVNHSLKQAGWQTEDALHRAAEKMRAKEGKVYGFTFDGNAKPETEKSKKGISDEERMMVLKMLQDKKISVEEAEKLLQALEK